MIGYAVVECAAGVFDFDVFDEAHVKAKSNGRKISRG